MHMCTELLNIFINYLKFLIIKILEGIQAEIKSITPYDNPENWQLTEPVQEQGELHWGWAKIIWNETLSGSQETGSQHRRRGREDDTLYRGKTRHKSQNRFATSLLTSHRHLLW